MDGARPRAYVRDVRRLDETRLLDFLEAVYALELTDQDWLTRALQALAAVCTITRGCITTLPTFKT